jgi:HTH-type transcriptional regulator / antitoxin HigA
MAIAPIVNEADHRRALQRIEQLWGAPEGSPDYYELDALATLVEHYEQQRWPLAPADPVAALKFIMDQNGWTQADLARLLGSRSRALTLGQIRLIAARWHAPVALLVGPLETDRAVA